MAEDGSGRAIKVFESVSSNLPLLKRQIRRVSDGQAGEVTVPVLAEALDERPAFLIMPFCGKAGPGSDPRNLQMEVGKSSSWSFLQKLARALEVLHRDRVAHGNLKPGNIFLNDSGAPLLSDYASGLMPGVHFHQYSDAVLYAPPEQLRDQEGYLEEQGYRWDVYAFGVLAYRLLLGRFPRADAIFEPVSPAFGTADEFEIEADHEGIARCLEADPEVSWPGDLNDEVEERRREILASCLELDPAKRPLDMIEVSRRLAGIARDLGQELEEKELRERAAQAEKQRHRANRRLVLVGLLALGLGTGWGVTHYLRAREAKAARERFAGERERKEKEVARLEELLKRSGAERDRALEAEAQVRRALESAENQAREELRSAQRVNDELFSWVLESGDEELPALKSRKDRLGILLQEIDQQLAGMASRPALRQEAALLRLRSAEVALAMENLEESERLYEEALASGLRLPGDAVARIRLQLLLLASKRHPAALGGKVAEAEKEIRAAFANNPSQLLLAEAALSLIKGRGSEAQGEEEKAFHRYLSALQRYRELEERFPGNCAITFAVGRTALTAARTTVGEEAEARAARLQAEAATAFETLAGKLAKTSPEVEYQITAARAGQAIARWQQGDLIEAETLARENLARLNALQKKMPDDFRVVVDQASQKGIVATSLRDEEKIAEARRMLMEGVASLEAGLEQEPDHGRAQYLLASLRWQLSGVVGSQGDQARELALARAARVGLESLLADDLKRPSPNEIRRSLAYLCGDLGRAADRQEQRDLAISHFEACRKYWEDLARELPESAEVREGHQWAVEQLKALRGK